MQIGEGGVDRLFYRHHAQAKRKAYEEESEGWSLSYSAKLTDVVRGMVMCDNAEDLLDVAQYGCSEAASEQWHGPRVCRIQLR